ncbi:DUF1697 domain-containing protein [Clavibacter michiganensis subsp. insidiosus]|uniref:DUF1697 domain-containing protein n=1 Tax=Clavibacter michiganensis TaxID=28447 RepID=UPI00360B0879
MAELAAALEGLGYVRVRTHLRSGNAVVDHERASGRGAAVAIEDAVRLATGVTRTSTSSRPTTSGASPRASRSASPPTTPPVSSSRSSTARWIRCPRRRPPSTSRPTSSRSPATRSTPGTPTASPRPACPRVLARARRLRHRQERPHGVRPRRAPRLLTPPPAPRVPRTGVTSGGRRAPVPGQGRCGLLSAREGG